MSEWRDGTFSTLIGKTIRAVTLDASRDELTFTTDEAVVRYRAYGDCCSSSWVEHLSDTSAVIGSPVVSVSEYAPDTEVVAESDYDHIQQYGWRIQTAKGGLDIEMRNSSNGYYGGSMELV